jgi:hypothetical protein
MKHSSISRLPRNLLRIKKFIDHLKNRSSFTEHPIQNNKDLTPGLGGHFTPAKVAKGIGFFDKKRLVLITTDLCLNLNGLS